jgi:NTP pyrophosphatase (non-canonical NTP hydrolase)
MNQNLPTPEMITELAAETGISMESAAECFAVLPSETYLGKFAADVDISVEKARASFAYEAAIRRQTALQALQLALDKHDPIGKLFERVSVALSRTHALQLVAMLQGESEKTTFTFETYAAQAMAAAFYPEHGTAALLYLAAKLGSESGELAGKVCKAIRDHGGVVDVARREAILDEAGDIVWYVTAIASELNSSLAEVARRNLVKVTDRKARGVQAGDGDNR